VSKNCLFNVPVQEGIQWNMNRATVSRTKNRAAVA
jgi:hypothetical protein